MTNHPTNHPLRDWRTRRDMTLQAFGERVGAAKSTIAAYELRLRFPVPAMLEAIERETNGVITASVMLAAYQAVGAPPERAAPTPPPGRNGVALLAPSVPGASSISKIS